MYKDTLNISLFGDLWAIPDVTIKGELNSIDLIIANLETPIINNINIKQSDKAGPVINGNINDFENISNQLNNLCTVLANNHIMDYGEAGLNETLNALKKNNISYCGVGENIYEAQKPLILCIKNIKIAIVSVAEIQFGIAQYNKAGYNPFNANIYAQIIELKKSCDIVIISIHASSEMSPIPSPDWQDTMRSLIDVGADIIHGHHSHVPQGYEKYNQGIIFYGLGNFIVNPDKWKQYKNTLWSLTPTIIYKDGEIKFEIKTSIIEKNDDKIIIRYANKKEVTAHFEYLKICNSALSDRKLLIGLWQELSVKIYENHFGIWLGFIKLPSKIIKLTTRNKLGNIKRAIIELFFKQKQKLGVSKITKNEYLLWYHLFACQSHEKIIETALGILGGEIADVRNKETEEIISKYFQ